MSPTRTALILLLLLPVPAQAGPLSLLAENAFLQQRPALIDTRRAALFGAPPPEQASVQVASLFIGQSGSSLFAPYPVRLPAFPEQTALDGSPVTLPADASAVERLRHIIGHAESRKHGYNAVQYGARVKPSKRPTDMTLAEIFRWISDTPGQPHAIGRYQFIPSTLKRLVAELGVPHDATFTPRLQDQLSDLLLAEAGLNALRAGQLSRHGFMNNLAKIWAGLPNSSGRSHYDGYAGNKASMTWARFDAEMARIFPG